MAEENRIKYVEFTSALGSLNPYFSDEVRAAVGKVSEAISSVDRSSLDPRDQIKELKKLPAEIEQSELDRLIHTRIKADSDELSRAFDDLASLIEGEIAGEISNFSDVGRRGN